jgi:2-polyprenyl-3-methyl-5-hydroxy-6-metoxy-1,4-benzoquinol methylase
MINNKDIEELNRCILCGNVPLVVDKKFGMLLGLVPPYEVKHCPECGLRWLSPRPTPSAYSKLYSYERYFDGSSTVEDYPKIAKERRFGFRKRIQMLEKILTGRKNLKILDIGAATGEFVHEALLRGHDATGIELSEGAKQVAKEKYGIELLGTEIEALEPTEKYDVVHMSHVLEHLIDPVRTLNICQSLLRNGGILVIEVPQQFYNDLDRLKNMLGMSRKSEFNAYSLHHTFFFNPENMSDLLKKTGFIIKSIKTANKNRTPLYPFSIKNLFLRYYLWLSDILHHGGNIIEVYAESRRQDI